MAVPAAGSGSGDDYASPTTSSGDRPEVPRPPQMTAARRSTGSGRFRTWLWGMAAVLGTAVVWWAADSPETTPTITTAPPPPTQPPPEPPPSRRDEPPPPAPPTDDTKKVVARAMIKLKLSKGRATATQWVALVDKWIEGPRGRLVVTNVQEPEDEDKVYMTILVKRGKDEIIAQTVVSWTKGLSVGSISDPFEAKFYAGPP